MIHFLKYKAVYFTLSFIILCVGCYFMIFKGFKYSIDFTGGSVIEYAIDKKIDPQKLSKAIKTKDITISSIEVTGNTYIIKTSPIEKKDEEKIRTKIEDDYKVKVTSQRFEMVGPSLGKETVNKTILASLVAIFGILAYISFTFRKLHYGLAAVIAMIHDFVILLSTYSIFSTFFGAEIDSLFITAVLTTMSFSVHDTIVVFDKIREYRKISGLQTEVLANRALTETMVRSINNSLTIVLMLIPLVIMGTATIRFFAAALLVGTITGTYSSPFIATPLLVMFEKWSKR